MADTRANRMDPGLIFILAVSLAFSAAFFALSVIRYSTLQYHDWDFAIYANSMWSLIHGSAYIPIYGRSFLGNHFNLIAFLTTPVYFIFRTPLTLLFLKDFLLVFVTVPVYLVARRRFSAVSSALFSLIYLAYPALFYVLLYEFHFEDFAPFFLAFSFYFLITNKKAYLFLFACLAALCKENIPPILAAMGIYAMIFRPHRRLVGMGLFISASLYFLLVTLFLQPIFTPESGAGYAHHYGAYGGNFFNIFIFILTHPMDILADIFSQKMNFIFFVDTFSPLTYLALLRPDILFIVLPTFLKNLLSRDLSPHTIYWHYAATLMPFLIISLIYTFKKLSKFAIIKNYLPFFLSAILFIEIVKGYTLYQSSHYFVRFHLEPTNEELAKQKAVKMVAPQASVIASFDFLPSLSQRRDIYTFYMLWKRGAQYEKIPDTEYALLDFNDFFVEKFFKLSPEKVSGTLTHYTLGENWQPIYAKGDIVLFKKDASGGTKILSLEKRGDVGGEKEPFLVLDNSLALLDLKIEPAENDNTLRLAFSWQAQRENPSLYKIFFFAFDGKTDRAFSAHSVGYKFLTPLLKENEVLRENYSLILPAKSGKYIYSFSIFDVTNGAFAKITPSGEVLLDKYGKVIIKERE